MLKVLTQFIVRFADLVEAEGRQLRRVVAQMSVGIAVLLGATAAAFAGAGLVLAAICLFLRLAVPWPWALLITGLLALLGSGVLVWLSARLLR